MAALPYMQLYVADYLADTAHLTTEEHGAYLLLIFSYWQTGKPLRADRLASVSRMSNERWNSVEDTLSEFFHVGPTHWNHFRIDADLEAVNSKVGKASAAGKASARAKAMKKQQEDNDRSTDVDETFQQNGNHIDTDTDTDKKDQKPCPQQAENGHQFKFSDIQASYNAICAPTLPSCKAMTDKRKRQIKRMVDLEFNGKRPFREHGMGMWESYFRDCLTNKHWIGENDRSWRADFDFVTKPDNAIKMLERICG